MEKRYRNILVLGVLAAVLLTTGLLCLAADEKEDVWDEDELEFKGKWIEPTEEQIEWLLDRIAETEPARADELRKLRDTNPEEFKVELRETMRRFARQKAGEWMKQEGKDFPLMGPGGRSMRAQRQGRERGFHSGRQMREKHTEYIEWLEKNYSDDAKKLAELREKDPELYMRQLGLSLKKYRRIKEASEENPQLAEVLKEDLVLKQKRNELLEQIQAQSDEKKKEELKKQLQEVLSSRFDIIVRRKQMAYEKMRKHLEELQKEVEQKEAEVKKWNDTKFKNESIKERLEELLSKPEKFHWE